MGGQRATSTGNVGSDGERWGPGLNEREISLQALFVGADDLRHEVLALACRDRGVDLIRVRSGSDIAATAADRPPCVVLVDTVSTSQWNDHVTAGLGALGLPTLALVDRTAPGGGGRPPDDLTVNGWVDVDLSPDELVAALRTGTAPAAPPHTETDVVLDELTDREHEVLEALLTGAGTEQLAERLAISEHTVRTHVQNLLAKLGVHSRAEAAAVALRAGMRPPAGARL